MQSTTDGHETEGSPVIGVFAMIRRADHDEPFQRQAVPLDPVAMQNAGEVQEMDCNRLNGVPSSFWKLDQDLPFHRTASVAWGDSDSSDPVAMQKDADEHETE